MILASDTITLARVNDGAKGATGKGVKSNTRYYCLQASATKPSKPTTNPPDSKWTTTEPSYTTGSTSYLYTVDLTVYTDNSFLYSDVSLSSSYEAAKAAYAKAVNAETEISKTNEEVALKASKNEVTETLKGYATTASMNAAITTKANEITSSVAANYSKQLWHTANGTVGTKGYVGFAELTITGSWSNRPILFCLTNRGAVESNISLRFENISGSDPGLYWIRETGGINTWVVKTATSKWTVIAKKSEGYDGINVNDFTNTNPNISIAWTDVHYDAIPDGAVESTKLVGSQAISEIATTADVNDIKTRVTSAETRITQTETDIKSKASQTELSGLTTRVSTAEQDIDAAEAAIKQKAEKTEVSGLSGRVSTVEEDLDAANAQIQLKVNQTEFDNLQIGGTNFTLNSSFSGLTNGGIYTFSGEEVTFNASSTGLTSGIAFWLDMSDNFCKQARNNKVTISVDYKIESALTRGTTNSFAGIQLTVARDTTTGGSSQWIPSHIEYTSVTNGWRKTSVVSDISDYDIANAYIGIYFRDVKGTIKFRHPKVEMGNKATDWSPAPEDAVTSVKTTTVTIDADGMNVSTGGTVEFNTSAFEITPPDGGDQLFSVNASTKNLKAQNGYFTYLSAPNAATKPTSTGTISRSIGNSSGYYPTIQAAWNSLPDVCGYVVFNVYSDSPGTALLNNKHIGNIIIQSNPNTSKFDIGSIEVQGISGVIQNVIMSRNGGQYQPACAVTGSSFQFINVTFATAGRGISIYNGGCALLNNCTITGIGSYDKPQDACLFVNGGVLTSNNTTGVSNNKGVGVYNGSLAVLKGTCPGPSVYAPSGTILGDYTIDGTVAEKPTVSQTATFTPSTWCTWECISGSLWKRLSVDVVVQSRSWSGLNNKTQYPNGFCKRAGWWVLDTGTAIKSALSGKTISRATITIRRDACSETYKVELAYHKVTNCNLNGYSVSADYNIANQLISIGLYDVKGDSDTVIDLPSSLYSKLQDGTIKGFGLLNNGTYFKDVYCDGTCTLNVTYT